MMASSKKQTIVGLQTSRGLKVQQPFVSPLRAPGTSKVSSTAPRQAGRSPVCHRKVDSLQSNSLASSHSLTGDPGRCEEPKTTEDGQETSSSDCVTPRKTLANHSKMTNIHQRKISPRQFSVPFRSPFSSASPAQSFVSKEEELNKLVSYENELDKEITTLKEHGFKVEELQGHIENLHKYNETKDSAQLVLGRLAELEGVTIKEMHEKYDVPTDE